jgi:DNA-binding MarR family transcriptional regulator
MPMLCFSLIMTRTTRQHPNGKIAATRHGVSSRAQLESRALLAARDLVDRMRTVYRDLERLSGAPISMHRGLHAIDADPGLQASKFAAALGMQRPAASHLLRAMVDRGWIRRARAKSDQRAVQIHLTAAGQRMLKLTSGHTAGVLQRSMRALGDADVERLALALPLLVQELQEIKAPSRTVAPRAYIRRASSAAQRA